MEIKQYLLLIRKWAWLLILGGVVGGALAYGLSLLQPVIYQTSIRIMVNSVVDQSNQNYLTAYMDTQLAQTYAQIINVRPVQKALSDKLGYSVNSGQISVKQISNANLLEITVSDGNPERAAEIANALVGVFIEYNQGLLEGRYKDTQQNLKKQIAEIENQIKILQTQMTQDTASTQENQKQQIDDQAKQIEKLLASADQEVIQIETQLDTFIPTPAVTYTPAPSWHVPTSTPVPVPTPTLSSANQVKYKELQIRRDQLNEMRGLFQQAYGNLLVMKQNSNSDPAIRQGQIQTTLALYQQIYSNLLSSYESVNLALLHSTPNIVQIDQATVPSRPVQPQPMRNAVAGALSGVFIMGVVAFAIEFLDDTIKTPEDVSKHLGVPVLGLISEMGKRKRSKHDGKAGVFVAENPLSPVTEGFRNLRTNLEFASVDKPIRTLQITSTGPSEGKSTLAVNLAAVIAQSERKVLLIDADLRRPSVHKYLGISNRKGLVDLFRHTEQRPDVINTWGTPPFQVITSGEIPPNPTELLASERMTKILDELKETVDIIVIDSPPSVISDPIALSAKVDGVLVVIEPGKTTIGGAQVMMEQLKRSGARVIGAVLNPISRRNSHYYTKYHYYSSYYYRSGGYNQKEKE
jgi:polysaccharide biosynthesis transport protein